MNTGEPDGGGKRKEEGRRREKIHGDGLVQRVRKNLHCWKEELEAKKRE